MRGCLTLLKKSASSSRWLQRQTSDPFVKQRNQNLKGDSPAYRSRASFKLLSIHKKYPYLLQQPHDFDPPKIVVDLGSAPGGWAQVAAHILQDRGRVFGLDILDYPEIPNVHCLKGDFLNPEVQDMLSLQIEEFRPPQFGMAGRYEESTDEARDEMNKEGLVDVVLSDMMAPMSGVRLRDITASLDLVQAATRFAFRTLKSGQGQEEWLYRGQTRYPGGHFLVKFFEHPDLDEFKKQVLQPRFHKIIVEKPPESRKESSEAYWLCLGFKGNQSPLASP